MKTLADVKRRAQLGVKLDLVYDEGFPVLTLKGNPPTREIVVKQQNAIAFAPTEWSKGKASWLYWPKAAEITITGPDSFHVKDMGTYTFV